jgi:hypothetical protein
VSIELNVELLKEFEEKLNPAKPEESIIPAKVLGYGEISTVFEIEGISKEEVAFKRMPLFENTAQVESYVELYFQYNKRLQEIGIQLPRFGAQTVITDKGRPVLYLFQEKLPWSSICHNLIHEIEDDAVELLVLRVMRELNKVWNFNKTSAPQIEVAIDGQISNFALIGFDPETNLATSQLDLIFLDTSTPLIRKDGVEQLDALLFLKPAPPILRWILKRYYLQEILDRYYDLRKVIIDLVANFFKEQRKELIPALIPVVNDFLANEAAVPDLKPISEKEIEDYYKDDASTWKLYLRSRRLHRFIKRKIFRRYYPYILPGKIKR